MGTDMRHFCSLDRATVLAAILATFFLPATAQQVTGSDTTTAGNGCGSCVPDIEDILAEES